MRPIFLSYTHTIYTYSSSFFQYRHSRISFPILDLQTLFHLSYFFILSKYSNLPSLLTTLYHLLYLDSTILCYLSSLSFLTHSSTITIFYFSSSISSSPCPSFPYCFLSFHVPSRELLFLFFVYQSLTQLRYLIPPSLFQFILHSHALSLSSLFSSNLASHYT